MILSSHIEASKETITSPAKKVSEDDNNIKKHHISSRQPLKDGANNCYDIIRRELNINSPKGITQMPNNNNNVKKAMKAQHFVQIDKKLFAPSMTPMNNNRIPSGPIKGIYPAGEMLSGTFTKKDSKILSTIRASLEGKSSKREILRKCEEGERPQTVRNKADTEPDENECYKGSTRRETDTGKYFINQIANGCHSGKAWGSIRKAEVGRVEI